jgi:AraC family transcriptional regulator
MSSQVLLVKNMVCHRCVLAAEDILRQIKVPFAKVLIGEIHLAGDLPADKKDLLQQRLSSIGFELIDNHTGALIEKIKTYVIRRVRNEAGDQERITTLSNYLSLHLHHEYTYLSSLFSSVEGRTIENFFIDQRIERAKELLVYGQMNLSEIAYELEYSSVAHLSGQFKKITGLTPSYFKQVGATMRKPLDGV